MWRQFLGCALALGLSAGSAYGDLTARISATDGYGVLGGEFNLTHQNLGFVPVGLTGSDVFESFCLEKTESIAFNFLFWANVTTAAVNGGNGGGNPDPLDPKTAYLYQQFITGVLVDYDYGVGDGGTLRSRSADDLQSVIWFLEDEEAMSWTPGDGSRRDEWYNLAVANAGDTIGNVRVINLFSDAQGTQPNQDQLVLTPEPGSLVLLALGGVFAWRRRVR
jgi:hypothetical protein